MSKRIISSLDIVRVVLVQLVGFRLSLLRGVVWGVISDQVG